MAFFLWCSESLLQLCQAHLGCVIPLLNLNVQKHLSESNILLNLYVHWNY